MKKKEKKMHKKQSSPNNLSVIKKTTTPKLKVKDLEASSPSKSFMRVFFFFFLKSLLVNII